MKIKTTFAALFLSALPSLTIAMGCGFGAHGPEQTTGICAVGQIWDATSATCVAAATS